MAGKAVKQRLSELQQLHSLLLRGRDVYQPEDLAAKLAASSEDVRGVPSSTLVAIVPLHPQCSAKV
jgi:hypothetical protein